MTFVDRQEIPEAFLKEHETDLKYRREALGVLQAFSLISKGGSGQNFDLHRLVQLVMRRWLASRGSSDEVAADALETVWKLYPYPEVEKWSICAAYLPHADADLSNKLSVGSSITRASLLDKISRYLTRRGEYLRAKELLSESISLKEQLLGRDDPDTLDSESDLVDLYIYLGQYQEGKTWD